MSKYVPAADMPKEFIKKVTHEFARYSLNLMCNELCVKRVFCEYLLNMSIAFIINSFKVSAALNMMRNVQSTTRHCGGVVSRYVPDPNLNSASDHPQISPLYYD